MIAVIVCVALVAGSADAFHVKTGSAAMRRSSIIMNEQGDGYDYKKKQQSHAIKESKKTGANFNYDPSNYKDSANEGNYRRLSDQMAAVKAEEEKMAREREELIRKEKMEKLLIAQENQTFWETPGDKIVATSDKYFVPPGVIEVINDLDNQVSHTEFKFPLTRTFCSII